MFAIRSRVASGHRRGGTQLGFPTANVELDASTISLLAPYENDVFAGWGVVEWIVEMPTATAVSGEAAAATPPPLIGTMSASPAGLSSVYPVVFSVGKNPHFKDVALTMEVHFVTSRGGPVFQRDFYGQIVRIVCVARLRGQLSFTSLDALIVAIKRDVELAVLMLERDDGTAARRLLSQPQAEAFNAVRRFLPQLLDGQRLAAAGIRAIRNESARL